MLVFVRRLLVCVAATTVAFGASSWQASALDETRPSCAGLEPGPARTVTRIIDGETAALDDGTELRLIGALAPRAIDAGTEPGTWPAEIAAMEELRVVEDELQTQNEELITAHLDVEIERRRYQELFDLAPDAYLVTNLAGIIDEANLSASRLLGIAREFLIGKALAAYIATEDRVRFRSLLNTRDRAGSSRPLAFRIRARGGANLHAELTYSIIDDHRGTADYRRHALGVLATRTLAWACA